MLKFYPKKTMNSDRVMNAEVITDFAQKDFKFFNCCLTLKIQTKNFEVPRFPHSSLVNYSYLIIGTTVKSTAEVK